MTAKEIKAMFLKSERAIIRRTVGLCKKHGIPFNSIYADLMKSAMREHFVTVTKPIVEEILYAKRRTNKKEKGKGNTTGPDMGRKVNGA